MTTPRQRIDLLRRAQEFLFKGGARAYEMCTDEVAADVILYAAAALHLATQAGGERAIDKAISTLKEIRNRRHV